MRRLAEEVIPEPGLHLEVGLLSAVGVQEELALEAGLAPPHVLRYGGQWWLLPVLAHLATHAPGAGAADHVDVRTLQTLPTPHIAPVHRGGGYFLHCTVRIKFLVGW